MGFVAFFFTQEGLAVGAVSLRALPIWLFCLPIKIPIQLSIGLVFLFLCSVYAICFIVAWRFRESLQRVLRKAVSRPTRKLFNNCLFAMPVIASTTMIAVVAIQSIQESSGIPTGVPPLPENPFETLLVSSYSPLTEEIGFRVSPIGIFLFAYLLLFGRKRVSLFARGQRLRLFIMSFLFPDRAKKLAGVKTVSDFGVISGISMAEWVMVTSTGVVFGLAHYVYGGGWEVGKISSAAVGVVLALTYLLYGVQAPILLLWFFNCYFTAFELASELWPSLFPAYTIVWIVTTVLGICGWLAVAILGINNVVGTVGRRTSPLGVESLT